MVDTALTIITDALLDLGVLADEEVPTASQAAGALRKLNNMIDSWNIRKLQVYGSTIYTLPMVAGKSVYTIGTGGDLNMPRPNFIDAAAVRDNNLPAAQRLDYPLRIFTDEEYESVQYKGQTADWPNYGIYFNYANPLIRVHPLPVPSSSQYSIVFWVKGILGNLLLNDPITLAPGYKRALTSNLSIELSPSYGVQVPAGIAAVAQESLRDIQNFNSQPSVLSIDPRIQGLNFNIWTGRYQ